MKNCDLKLANMDNRQDEAPAAGTSKWFERERNCSSGRPPGIAVVLLALVFLAVFAVLAEDVYSREYISFDSPVIEAVRGHSDPVETVLMQTASFMGSAPVLISVTIMLTLLLSRQFRSSEHLLPVLVLSGAWLLNIGLKYGFHRLRPGMNPLISESGFSFPSGHAMVSMAVYGLAAFLLFQKSDNPRLKWCSALILGSLVGIIGISRVYLGVHYPSDVLAGYAAGCLWLLACIGGFRYTESHNEPPESMNVKS